MTYFPFTEYWWFYLAFSGFVVLLLALDLGVFHRTVRPVSFREATAWSVVLDLHSPNFQFLLLSICPVGFRARFAAVADSWL